MIFGQVLSGKRVLVVEDDYYAASDLRARLVESGVEVVGPSPDVDDAIPMSSVFIRTSVQSEAKMEERYDFIKDLDVIEREEIFIDIARALEQTARDAFIEGYGQFAAMSTSMAEAIRINADELARDDLHNSERVLQQAAAMIAKFKAAHPYPLVSKSVH